MKASTLRGITFTVTMAVLVSVLAGCAVLPRENRPYRGDKYLDARQPSGLSTIGIESSDLQAACNQAVAKLLASPIDFGTEGPPAFIVEDPYFVYEARGMFNPNALVDYIRNELLNAAAGRIRLLDRGYGEKDGADFALGAHITDVKQRSGNRVEHYIQIAFEVVNLKNSLVVFSDLHSFKKAANITSSS